MKGKITFFCISLCLFLNACSSSSEQKEKRNYFLSETVSLCSIVFDHILEERLAMYSSPEYEYPPNMVILLSSEYGFEERTVAKFSGSSPKVLKYNEKDWYPDKDSVLRSRKDPEVEAILIAIEEADVYSEKAEIYLRIHMANLGSETFSYHFKRKNGAWVIIERRCGPIS